MTSRRSSGPCDRECRRTDEVREHHRDLAALGGLSASASGERGAAVLRLIAPPAISFPKHLPAMPERNAKVYQSPDRSGHRGPRSRYRSQQSARHTRTCRLFEPVRNLLHRGAASGAGLGTMWRFSLNDLLCRALGTLPPALEGFFIAASLFLTGPLSNHRHSPRSEASS